MKLKTLTGALEIMIETRHAFRLIHKELQEQQQSEVYIPHAPFGLMILFWQVTIIMNMFNAFFFVWMFLHVQTVTLEDTVNRDESSEAFDGPASSGLNTEEVMKLIGVFEPSFSFLLLQLIKFSTTSKRKSR